MREKNEKKISDESIITEMSQDVTKSKADVACAALSAGTTTWLFVSVR